MLKQYYANFAVKIGNHFSCRLTLNIPITRLVFLLAVFQSGLAVAHAGKQDNQGGHFNRKTNTYHCHTKACFQQHGQSEQALEEAHQESRAFSKLYLREDWPHWSDLDNDCQDTRAEILIASSKTPVRHSGGNTCFKVLNGEWHDPYTDKVFYNAWQLDIDHRIALAEAHRYGGANWTTAKKEAFANDPLNLIAVQADANRSKGSHPAYEWMPKDLKYWCEYIQVREQVVLKYALTFPEKEQTFNQKIKQQYCH